MALKKPSDFFREDDKSDDTIHELVKRPELQSFSEAFSAYKNNLDKLDNLTDTIKYVEDIKSEIQDFIKKEDLDNSMMGYTFLLEESIIKLKNDVTGINEKPLAAGETSSSKVIYQHETGFNNDVSSMDGVFIESADIDITDGDSFVFLKKIIPDILFQTQTGTSPDPAINVVVKRRDFSNQTLTTDSTTQIKNNSTFSNLRTRTRQFVLRFESDDDNTEADRKNYKWRLGNTRVDIQQSGRR